MIYLGLGSNIEPRREFLKQAKAKLQELGHTLLHVSPIYETPALLPLHAQNDWQKNFLNQVIAMDSNKSPALLLQDLKIIESELGRNQQLKWGPRPIDIDILLFHNEIIDSETLQVPHPQLPQRNFFLKPLLDVAKDLWDQEVFHFYSSIYKSLAAPLPQWMYIANVTPDSFSTSNSSFSPETMLQNIQQALEAGAHIIDLGAESTRPNATPLTAKEEWQRLEPIFDRAKELTTAYEAKLSIDTYHVETMRQAIEAGADIINDVGGLSTPATRELFLQTDVEWIAMHNLGLPANPQKILPKDQPAHQQILQWIEALNITQDLGHRLIIDPGIGFGKDSEQARDILNHIHVLQDLPFRLLVGHSRKSFLTGITHQDFKDRDLETVAISLKLASKGVDILRIHNMEDHRRAHLSYNI